MLVSPEGLPPGVMEAIGVLWMVTLGASMGFPRWPRGLGIGVVCASALASLAVSADLPYLRGSLPHSAALIAGGVMGLLARRRMEAR
jgi:hypothetical protein